MPRAAVLALIAAALAAAGCAEPPPGIVAAGQARPVALPTCDDGGDGGVMIDGVCL